MRIYRDKLYKIGMAGIKNPYENVVRFYDEEYHKIGISNSNLIHLNGLARKIKLEGGEYILDIAYGTGSWLSVVNQYSQNTFGIDISETAIRACKRNLAHGRFCIGLGEKLPFKENSFNVVTCLGLLEHFLDQVSALNEIRRVVKDTAKIVILVPNSDFLTYKLELFKGTNQSKINETIRSISEWKNLIKEGGIEVTETWADLHVVNREWIMRRGLFHMPFRALQAFMLLLWPLKWQYQIHFLCQIKK